MAMQAACWLSRYRRGHWTRQNFHGPDKPWCCPPVPSPVRDQRRMAGVTATDERTVTAGETAPDNVTGAQNGKSLLHG